MPEQGDDFDGWGSPQAWAAGRTPPESGPSTAADHPDPPAPPAPPVPTGRSGRRGRRGGRRRAVAIAGAVVVTVVGVTAGWYAVGQPGRGSRAASARCGTDLAQETLTAPEPVDTTTTDPAVVPTTDPGYATTDPGGVVTTDPGGVVTSDPGGYATTDPGYGPASPTAGPVAPSPSLTPAGPLAAAVRWQQHNPYAEVSFAKVALSPDGRTVAAGGQHNIVLVYDVTATTLRCVLHGPTDNTWSFEGSYDASVSAMEFSPDGTALAIADGHSLQLWNPATGALRWSAGGDAVALAFSPDGAGLLVGTSRGEVQLRDAGTGLVRRHDVVGPGEVASVAFSRDGRSYAAVEHAAIGVWQSATGLRLHNLAVPQPSSLLSPGVDQPSDMADYDRVNRELATWQLSVTFSPDGQLVTGGNDGRVRFWDLGTGRVVRQLVTDGGVVPGASLPVNRVSFSGDGTALVTVIYTSSATAWDVATGTPRGSITAGDSVAGPDGSTLLTTNGYDQLQLLTLTGR